MTSPRASWVLVAGFWFSGCTPAPHGDTKTTATILAEPIVAELAGPSPSSPPSPPSPPDANGELLLYDFSLDNALSWTEPQRAELDALLLRFPHPHAAPGASCDPNRAGTPPAQRMGGILLPRVTSARGAFTRAGSTQTAYFIDYCPTDAGVPRTRRIVVLSGEAVALDHELPSDVLADEVLRAVDVNGDGLAELLLTVSLYDARTTQSTTGALLYQLQGGAPRVLGRWTGIAHCYSGHDDMITHRIHARRKAGAVSFRDEAIQKHCYYPPSPPPPPPPPPR